MGGREKKVFTLIRHRTGEDGPGEVCGEEEEKVRNETRDEGKRMLPDGEAKGNGLKEKGPQKAS